MIEMAYHPNEKRELLFSGTYKGYDFYVLNLGTHPTAYVNVANDLRYNLVNYEEINIDVHGGLTYSENFLLLRDIKLKGWFIGWDYAHFGDYTGYDMAMPVEFQTNEKRWTTKEIFEEVKKVIDQLEKGT